MQVKRLFNFIKERYYIYEQRAQGLPKPWTADPILKQYRFCNVHRENDAVTRWIANNWREPNRKCPELWFAMVVARMFNLPQTLKELGFPVPYRPQRIYNIVQEHKEHKLPVFNGAYIVSTNGRAMEKDDYLVQYVFTPLWAARKRLNDAYRYTENLSTFAAELNSFNGLGSFMAAQVIADLKYVPPLFNTDDWWTWAASGPGSRRGLNRVIGADVDESWPEKLWLTNLQELQKAIDPLLKKAHIPRLHAQDLQNCLCEFDKYERARLGEGRPKQRYEGSR